MPRAVTLAGLVLAALVAAVWLAGGFDGLPGWLLSAQRATQNRLAGAVQALRSGQPGALAGLLAVCYGYGVLHAAGPGHGKALIGAFGVARRVPLARLAALSVASALAQAAVAVVLVQAAVTLLGLTREAVTDAGEGWVTAAGNLVIAGLGLWLVLRGLMRLVGRPARTGAAGATDRGHGHGHGHGHVHDHAHDAGCGCGHSHGPDPAQVEAAGSWQEMALLVAGVAMRPCTGALLLLVLTWQLGLTAAGILGAFAMGLGVATVSVGVAVAAVWAREGGIAVLSAGGPRWLLPLVEVAAGLAIMAVVLAQV